MLHFVKNMQVSLYPLLRNRGRRVGGADRTTACCGVSCSSSPLVGLFLLLSWCTLGMVELCDYVRA